MEIGSWHELGEQLRAARTGQHRSLREVAKAAYCSHSTLHRLEQGMVAGRQDIVAAIDELYGAGGRFADAYGRLIHPMWRSSQVPLDRRRAKGAWQHTYPAEHDGNVWIFVKPTPGQARAAHDVELNWGPWRRLLTLSSLEEAGAVLVTGKSTESLAVPLRVDVSPAAHLLFGTDDERLDLGNGTALHRGWMHVDAVHRRWTRTALVERVHRLATDQRIPAQDRRLLAAVATALGTLDERALRRLVEALLSP